MTERLRFTGAHPVTFLTGSVGPVEPGGEFGVSDDLAPGFLRRPDIECAAPGGGGGTPGDGDRDDLDAGGGDLSGDEAGQDAADAAPGTGEAPGDAPPAGFLAHQMDAPAE